jgi:hypothetical protein
MLNIEARSSQVRAGEVRRTPSNIMTSPGLKDSWWPTTFRRRGFQPSAGRAMWMRQSWSSQPGRQMQQILALVERVRTEHGSSRL